MITLDPVQRFPKPLFIWFLTEYVPGPEIAKCIRLSKKWKEHILSSSILTKKMAFESSVILGPKQWKCLGDVGIAPPLPDDIKKNLEQPCPYHTGKKIYEIYKLLLIPEKLNQEFFGFQILLERAEKIDQNIQHQNRTCFGDEVVNETNRRPSYWVLVQTMQLAKSFNKCVSNMKMLLKDNDRMLTRLETTALLIIHYLNSKNKEILLRPEPNQYYYNICSVKRESGWEVLIGYAFNPWLYINYARQPFFNVGMAAARDL